LFPGNAFDCYILKTAVLFGNSVLNISFSIGATANIFIFILKKKLLTTTNNGVLNKLK
jgi:hypothetical protein